MMSPATAAIIICLLPFNAFLSLKARPAPPAPYGLHLPVFVI